MNVQYRGGGLLQEKIEYIHVTYNIYRTCDAHQHSFQMHVFKSCRVNTGGVRLYLSLVVAALSIVRTCTQCRPSRH